MSKRCGRFIACAIAAATIGSGTAHAQGRGGSVWTTTNNDAQRSSSVRNDPRISKDSLSKPGFQLLWKRRLEAQPKQVNALTQPVFSAPGFITYKGFKALAYLGGASDSVYSLDYDLNKMFWTTKLTSASTAAGTAACPGGLTTITENTQLGTAGGGGRGAPGGAGGRGAAGGAPPAGAQGGIPPAAPPAQAGGRGSGGRGAVAGLFAVSSGGMLHNLNLQTGTDWFTPVKLLPAANAKVVGSILVNSVLYVATADNCGGVPNGVYAIDLTPVPAPQQPPGSLPVAPVATPASTAVAKWESKGGGVAGPAGPALGTDGTVYVATTDGDYSATAMSDAVVALENNTLKQKDYFTPGKTAFSSSPIVFQYKGKDLVAAANNDGRLYLLDSASLGGADHKTPLSKSAGGTGELGALSTLEDVDGNRWIFAAASGAIQSTVGNAANGAVVAFKVVDRGGATAIEIGWVSRNLMSPVTPTVTNGVLFALSSGETRAAGQRSSNAVLYALDATTGKELWNSGTTIAAPVHGIGPAANDGQVYVVTVDGTLYAFGFVVER